MIEVILLERIERLGRMGDIVKVKPGYARNFLLPKRKALRATNDNRKYFETQRAQIEAENLKRKDEASVAAKSIDGRTVVLIRQAGDTGQLYGSVSTRDIADALTDSGAHVNKSQVVLDKPIKALGIHSVRLVLHPEVAVTIKANVARSPEEAELQAKGVDVARMRDEAPEPAEAPADAEASETAEA